MAKQVKIWIVYELDREIKANLSSLTADGVLHFIYCNEVLHAGLVLSWAKELTIIAKTSGFHFVSGPRAKGYWSHSTRGTSPVKASFLMDENVLLPDRPRPCGDRFDGVCDPRHPKPNSSHLRHIRRWHAWTLKSHLRMVGTFLSEIYFYSL